MCYAKTPHSWSSFVIHSTAKLLHKLMTSFIHSQLLNSYCMPHTTSGSVYIKLYETNTFHSSSVFTHLLWRWSIETKDKRTLGMHARKPGLHTYPPLSPALHSKYPGYNFLIIYFGLRTQYFLIHWITQSTEIRLMLLTSTLGPLSIRTQEEGSLRQRSASHPDYLSWKHVWGAIRKAWELQGFLWLGHSSPKSKTTSINPLHFSHWADIKLK